MLKNEFYNQVKSAEGNNAGVEELIQLLGRSRAKKECLKEIYMMGNLRLGKFPPL